jgi:hypothetical protein
LVQVPKVPARPHEAQPPAQAVAQQNPCWQRPEAHWAVDAQTVPSGCSEQVVPLQTLGAVQSALAVQVVLQTLLVVSQAKAPHDEVVGGVQVPVPLHSAGGVNTALVQVAAAHCVPEGYFWQAPAPLQKPLLPQLAAPALVQRAPGSVPPDGTLVQVPMLLVSAHDWQVPAQAVLQQKPCAQKFEPQSVLAAQAAPIGNFPQLIAVQTLGEMQSVLPAQVVRQAVAPQLYGTHDWLVPATHLPAPSQRLAGDSVEPVQLCARQTFPLG